MTIAICLKVHDGLVLAADSASTLMQQQPDGQAGVVNVYNNANKIVNLYKGLPLGVVTWGGGSIGPASMTTIFKDLRSMFVGRTDGPDGEDWKLNPTDYKVHDVAVRVREYVYEKLYQPAFKDWPDAPEIGMIVGGYSEGAHHAESYQIDMSSAGCNEPQILASGDECGINIGGQFEVIARLVTGVDPRLAQVLNQNLGVADNEVAGAMLVIQDQLSVPLIQPAMPIADALDLAHFLVEVTVQMSRFLPGPATVGGPIEVAAITQHEGFKWIHRKHYYGHEYNPQERA